MLFFFRGLSYLSVYVKYVLAETTRPLVHSPMNLCSSCHDPGGGGGAECGGSENILVGSLVWEQPEKRSADTTQNSGVCGLVL